MRQIAGTQLSRSAFHEVVDPLLGANTLVDVVVSGERATDHGIAPRNTADDGSSRSSSCHYRHLLTDPPATPTVWGPCNCCSKQKNARCSFCRRNSFRRS